MVDRMWSWAGVAAGLAALAGLVMLAGCTPGQWAYWERQRNYPADYSPAPLGPNYDTPAEVAQIPDENIRGLMIEWLDLRKEYLRLWRERGGYDEQVKRIRNRLASLRAVIEHAATQYGLEGA